MPLLKSADVGWFKNSSALLTYGWCSALLVGPAVWLFGIFTKFPQGLLTTDTFVRLDDFLKLCANPFARNLAEPILAYRISVPFIAWTLHLPPLICTYIQLVFLIAAYGVLFYVISKRTANPLFAILVVAGLSQTFFAHSTNRWFGIPDSFSHLCSALALLSSNPLALLSACIFGTLNDERWVFSIPFIIYWHCSAHAKVDVFDWILAARTALILVGGLVIVLTVRHALTVGWIGPGIRRPDAYALIESVALHPSQPVASTWPLFILNVFMGFGWYWLAIAKTVRRQVRSAVPISGLIVGGALFVGTLATVAGSTDVSRSIGYLYLGIVVAGVYGYDCERSTIRFWQNLLFLSCITPTIYYAGLSGAVLIPFPFELGNYFAQRLFGVDLMESIKLQFFRIR